MVTIKMLSNRKFIFSRSTGEVISDNIVLSENGRISGSNNSNEARWDVEDNNLRFLSVDGIPTTVFDIQIRLTERVLFIGHFRGSEPIKIIHVLVEKEELSHRDVDRFLQVLNQHTHDIKQTLNLCLRKSNENIKQPAKVLFLIHNVAAWDGLAEIYYAMTESRLYDPILAAITHRYPGEDTYSGDDLVIEELAKMSYRALKICSGGEFQGLDLIKCLNPDIIFRQSPWDNDYHPAFATIELSFSKLCYVPYFAANIVDNFESAGDEVDLHCDQPFHRSCFKIFLENQFSLDQMILKSGLEGRNCVVTGNPKFDRLFKSIKLPSWPIVSSSKAKNYRLVWAPHHSLGSDWLGFGVFNTICDQMLDFARRSTDIDFVLKPHPALFSHLKTVDGFDSDRIKKWQEDWNALPNTESVYGGNYGPLLSASDALLTDGISFLVEYQIFNKPLFFLDSGKHAPFNQMGKIAEDATIRVESFEEFVLKFEVLRDGRLDLREPQHVTAMRFFFPETDGSSERILFELSKAMGFIS